MPSLARPDGTHTAYDVVGDGPPVAFLHGLTGDRRWWTPVTDLLADRFACVRVDLRGHGESSRAPDYGALAMAGDVKAVIDEVGMPDPVVVGHSMGAVVAFLYCVTNPARAAVCVDQSLRFGDFAARVRPHAHRLREDGCADAVLDVFHGIDLAPYDGIEEIERGVREFPCEVVLGVWKEVLTMPSEQLDALATSLLHQCGVPLLAIHGSTPEPGYESWLLDNGADAEFELWDGRGHMLHLVEPERFAARVVRFVEGLR